MRLTNRIQELEKESKSFTGVGKINIGFAKQGFQSKKYICLIAFLFIQTNEQEIEVRSLKAELDEKEKKLRNLQQNMADMKKQYQKEMVKFPKNIV